MDGTEAQATLLPNRCQGEEAVGLELVNDKSCIHVGPITDSLDFGCCEISRNHGCDDLQHGRRGVVVVGRWVEAVEESVGLKGAKMNIKELCEESHKTALEHGWWEGDPSLPEKLCLMHSELSEALEEYRDGKGISEWYQNKLGKFVGIPIELADCVIRIADLCGRYGIDLDECLRVKLEYNKSRPHRHGGKKA